MAGAIVGIGISLVPLVLVLVVSDGMIRGITNRYMETKTSHIQAAIPAGMDAAQAAAGLEEIRKVKGVRGAWLERNGSGVALSSGRSSAIFLRAVDAGYLEDPGTRRYLQRVEGEMIPRNGREIVLGSALAASLGAGLGTQLTIVSPRKDEEAASQGFSPRVSIFKVSGIVTAGYRDLDALWAFVTPSAGERILDPGASEAFLAVKVEDPFSNSLGDIRKSIAVRLEEPYSTWFEGYFVRSWPEIEKSLYRSFGTTKSMLLLIMAIALIVAAVNLGSSLSTFVAEHSLEIAILRSGGASDSALRGIFTATGLLTGGAGTLTGLGAGLLLAWNINPLIRGIEWSVNLVNSGIALLSGRPAFPVSLLDPAYYLEHIPVSVDFAQIALIGLASLGLSTASSLLPARKATKVSVQELVRRN
jgi:lipoprotein-releasing system permease protein